MYKNVGGFAPTRPKRSPQKIMQERHQRIQRQRMEKLYNALLQKEKEPTLMWDVQKLQLYFLKVLKEAENMPYPVAAYTA